ncbi:MAG: FecR domain-containing protein [Alphaproteobacteria bacterium]|nr:FecR domain-containing protein [Alphaproteobacteria bacterium]
MSDPDPHLADFKRATEPDPGRLARLRAGRPPRRRLGWVAVPAAAALAAVFLLRTPPPPPEPAPAPAPVDARWAGAQSAATLGPWVRARIDGRGEVRGDAQDMVVDWIAGAVTLEVTPDQGVQLQVRTEEGVVRVTGTAFEVRRDALGTAVAVTRGSVAVTCGQAPPVALGAGDDALCLPVTAVGWLRRVTALQPEPEAVVAGAAAGLALSPEPAVALELRLQRAAAWAALGSVAQARAELDALLNDHPESAPRIDAARRALPPAEAP